ncbi:MAG TPA: hypothetical protein VMF58_01840 [Rhizomicrobium sp.]|nr:hypothetical protein [Rhizomicrobium sp.]
MTRAVPASVLLLLTGCIGTGPTMPVTTEARAISIAKERCSMTRPFDAGETWHAKLRDGLWHVWLTRDIDPREPVVGTLDIWIRASDGDAQKCNAAN